MPKSRKCMKMSHCHKYKFSKTRVPFKIFGDLNWMDGVARLEDGCPQVPGATCYQDNVLFIVVLQGSAATALSPSDLSIIQPAHEGTASGLQV